MTHLRKQIRDAAETLLTGLVTTGSEVHQGQVYTVQTFPALLIYIKDEASEIEAKKGPPTIGRVATLIIEGCAQTAVSAPGALPNTLDQIALEVEVAMSADVTFGGLARRSSLQQTEIEFFPEGEKQDGRIRLTYSVQYRAAENDPETAL